MFLRVLSRAIGASASSGSKHRDVPDDMFRRLCDNDRRVASGTRVEDTGIGSATGAAVEEVPPNGQLLRAAHGSTGLTAGGVCLLHQTTGMAGGTHNPLTGGLAPLIDCEQRGR
jgi:hypothetical protein